MKMVDNCPICDSELIKKDVTPCMDCGGDKSELNHYKDHSYMEYETYFGQRLVLCNFCDVDFGSYDPEYLGFPKGKRLGLEDFNIIKEHSNRDLSTDKFCPSCNHRFSFLKFVDFCRSENEKTTYNNV